MSDLRFLIIEDDPETLEFNEWVLRTEFNCQAVSCSSHKEALDILKSDSGPWSCFIVDYRTRVGTLAEFVKAVQSNYSKIPIILIHAGPLDKISEFKKRPIDQTIPKVYDAFQLISSVKKALNIENEFENKDFVSLRFESLSHLSKAPCDLFVRINEQKYTKIADQGTQISLIDPLKYQKKGADSLFCRRNDWVLILPAALQSVTTRMQMEVFKKESLSQFKLSVGVQELIQTTIRNFGWSDEIVDLAEQNIKMAKSVISSEKNLRIFEKFFSDNNYEQSAIHSVLLNYILIACYKNCPSIQSESELDTLCLAAFIHDGFLEEHQIRNESQFVRSVMLNIGANKSDRTAVEKHPQQIFEIIKNWPKAPRHLSAILLEHHERPDGKGFPNKLKSIEISRLGFAFIIAHEITELYLQSRDIVKVYNEFLKQKELFSSNPYTYFKCAIEMLEKATQSSKL